MTTHWPISVSGSQSSGDGVLACASCGQILVNWSRKAFLAWYSEDFPGLWCFNRAAVLVATDYLLQVVLPINHFLYNSGQDGAHYASQYETIQEGVWKPTHGSATDLLWISGKTPYYILGYLWQNPNVIPTHVQRACRQKALSAKLLLWMALHRPRGRFRQQRERFRIKSVTNI